MLWHSQLLAHHDVLEHLPAACAYQAVFCCVWILQKSLLLGLFSEPEGYQVIPRYRDLSRVVSRDIFGFNKECINSSCAAVNSSTNGGIH